MGDYADLGLSAIEYAVDRYHDRVYDIAATVPSHARKLPKRFRRRRPSIPGGPQEIVEIERESPGQKPATDQLASQGPSVNSASKLNRTHPRTYNPNMSTYSDQYQSEATYSRGSRGADGDRYEPEQYGMRNIAARDGYAPGDGYANPDGRAGAPPQYATYADSAYNAEEGRGAQQQRYLEYDRQGYGEGRSRSHDDLARSRPYYDDDNDDDDEDDYYSRRRGSRRHRSHDRDRKRSRSRGSRRSGGGAEDDEGNTELKKWGATLAGAAVGAYGGRRARKDNWVPAAIGAVVGGLVAREAEKVIVKNLHERKEERRVEEGYRSRSR